MSQERSREPVSTALSTQKTMPTPLWKKDSRMRSLVILSVTLFAVSFLAIVFKAVSEYAWAKPARENSFPIAVDNGDKHWGGLSVEAVELISGSTSTGLLWSSITLSLLFSFVGLYSARRITRHGPYYCTKVQRLIVYITLHICYVLPVVTFIYLTVIHAKSANFSPYHQVEDGVCLGFCNNWYQGYLFDLETWACDLHSFPGFTDQGNTMGRICVGETAARGLALVMGLLVAAIVVVVELERRLGRRFMTSWKVRAREECELDERDEEDMWGA